MALLSEPPFFEAGIMDSKSTQPNLYIPLSASLFSYIFPQLAETLRVVFPDVACRLSGYLGMLPTSSA